MEQCFYNISEVSNLLSVSTDTLRRWDKKGKLTPIRHPINNYRVYHSEQLMIFEKFQLIKQSHWEKEQLIKPSHKYTSIELFAGCGGLALGLEKAGFNNILLNEINKDASKTLKKNKPNWNVKNCDIHDLSFKKYKNKIDLVSGGFPCQSFSYAGNKLGLNDARGTLFFEFTRVIKEIQPKTFIAENVKGLLSHERGKTLEIIKSVLTDLGYIIIEPRVIQAIYHKVPQKRERLLIIGIRNDIYRDDVFKFPDPYSKVFTMKDALKKGELYPSDVPNSIGQKYPEKK